MSSSRRDFISKAAAASLALGATPLLSQETKARDHKAERVETKALDAGKAPVIVGKHTAMQSIDGAYELLRRGHDTLDACMFMCRTQEDDPNDDTVGLGGLPNEEGEVELDACCMHGPTRRAGAVGAVRGIKNVSLLARAVMEHTGHVMLAGEGAQRFALAHGFQKENLLTDRARKIWLLWKETMSDRDWWGPGPMDPHWKPPANPPRISRKNAGEMLHLAADLGIEPELRMTAVQRVLHPPTGTIHVSVVNEKGEMSGATTTAGLAFKIAGRLGDSPIIGAGCYTDQDVGSAGATGSGEENIRVVGAHTIVENMRHGMSPQEAGLDVLKRIARNYNNDEKRLRYVDMVYYVLRKDGAYAGVSLWSNGSSGKPHVFAVHDGSKRLENTVALLQGTPIDWPPVPELPSGK